MRSKQITRIVRAKRSRIRGLGANGSGKCFGTSLRPRLSVFKSNRQIYAQIIDDIKGVTIASCSSLAKSTNFPGQKVGRIATASTVGQILGNTAKNLGITKIKFDRNGFKYHGRIKSLADSARAAGLIF